MRGGASTTHSGTLVSGFSTAEEWGQPSVAALADCMLWGRGGCEKGSPRARKLRGRPQEGWC